jgi:hypothetical protein
MSDYISPTMFLSALGGLTASFMNLLEIGKLPKDRRPDLKDWLYWLNFAAGPALGLLVGFLYSDGPTPLGRIVSFQLGLSAPLIVRSAATVIPSVARQSLPPGA